MGRFSAADDLLHDITGRPHGRESLFWVLPVPHQGMLGLAYLYRDADTGKFGRIVALADSVSAKPLFWDVAGDLDMEGDDLDDCVVGGLHVRQPDPLRTAEITFTSGEVRLQCSMTGLHEPFSWHEGADGCPAWAADERYEQSVRTTGVFSAGGRTVEFDSAGHRDHSWGTHNWRALQHWKWMNASTPDGEVSVHAWISYALGDRQVNGYVNRAGAVSPIVVAEAKATLDDQFMHQTVVGSFTTADGRELRLEAEAVAGLPVPARHLQMNEIACSATFDGAQPAIAHIELGWPQTYVSDYIGPA